MTEITTLFWDVGGVILTNGWDRMSRRQAAQEFNLDWDDFQDRHELVVTDFEAGRLTLEEYLMRTVFYRPRSFTKEEFRTFMLAQSRPYPETLAIVGQLARANKYLLATLNNESLELNLYRIDHFGLRDYFDLFFSSCFLGVKKPEEAIYRLALQVTQRDPNECVFIDDRTLNLECASDCGLHIIHYQDPAQLLDELSHIGVETTNER